MPNATVRLLCLLLLVWSALAPAQTPGERGLEIAREADRRDQGWQTFSADLTMVLRNREGETSVRRIRAYNLEVPGDGDRGLLVFHSPADVAGTKFLTFSHKRGDDDQWLYLPALKRVKRISAANKGGSFMGSEFAYEDMSPPELEKFSYRYLRDDDYKGRKVFVIERYPLDERSLYSRQVVWLDKEFYIPWKIEYYNRSGEHIKTLTHYKYKRYLGKYWRAGYMLMSNHRNGKSTELKWTGFHFHDPDISEASFDPQALTR
ncbi:hypothetical protein MIT9_P2427 [Methylomarinovum caldicuralii]|uniref:Uncharacterized protein TP-0789 domain-containing protein n=1 Tax=Methylomarinovum caldicuralii TaxID=438856 RepID=A0AAU9C6M1_9GAMM|nr:outer membrane lipoprotein-sorting protein [Methylomarinovum caldicuralii]BCX82839.1 hypothetical protein MIT9_P2427 [Methylomarinovum caldicuralii]